MRLRRINWMVLGLLLAAGAWFFWPQAKRLAAGKFAPPIAGAFHSASTAPQIFPLKSVAKNSGKAVAAAAETNRFAWRLGNTTKSIGELQRDGHAILLENALIDTRAKLDFSIPKNLQAQGDPGAYVVQANGTIGPAFRAMLAAAGVQTTQIISYIPNNAYLVRISSGGANRLAANPLAQSVIPYEPYYKVQLPLLAYDQTALPAGAELNLGLFADNAAATIRQIEKLGGSVLSQESEPFGVEVRVRPPPDWTALAQLPGVQIVEENHARELANDLSRVTTGVATNTVTGTNYLGLTGSHVIVAVDDSGIDAKHPDFSVTGSATSPGTVPPSRVTGDAPQSLTDTNGHGTFVAGEIGGNGSESLTITTVPQGSVSNADFRGMAPMAALYSIGGIDGGADTNVISDRYLQESAALTNALISNNSWSYGDNLYDLAAASYDAATRDALMGVTGPQPVLFVFAAGNDGQIGRNGGNGDDAGGGGTPDTITSPGTAKDVIAVGALEQDRGITNTYVPHDTTNPVEAWNAGTDSSSQVADYSGRGNVGIGTEGTFGRFKPDVVAPGSFVISTRSQQWDQQAYYNPTNVYVNDATFQLVDTNPPNYYNFPFVVQNNAVSVSLQILPNDLSPVPFPPDLPIYVSLDNYPDPANPGTYDFETMNESVTIPTDGGAGYLQSIINNLGGFNFAVGDSTNLPVNYDLVAEMVTTNDLGDYYTVLSNLNGTLGPWYRYESGTSMAAADVSGVLALMQDFFTNTLHLRPSPALLKAMLINGARPTGYYNLQVDNNLNLEGWGLVNLPNSIPAGITNAANTTLFFVDQSPTNELATGDSRTYNLSLSPGATAVPLRLTLAWTDPPGNPAAAIKLVNNLDLIVTNTDNNANPVVYYGNDIGPNQVFNTPENSTNAAPNLDDINNVENVFLPADAGTNFTVVIRGTAVNVNAVTANTNNIVQDFAFVVSSGNGSNTNGFSITANPPVSNPTGGQRITVITATNAAPLMNQFVGASSPLPGTNVLLLTSNPSQGFGNDWQVTLGQTNQWHFYVATNYGAAADFTNAAFVTFLPPTAAIPRGGVFADSDADSTRPEADLDLYVTTDSNLLILSPVTISNCVNGTQVGASSPGGVNGVFYGAALDRGGSEFVVDTNSTPGQVYYVGVKSEDQMAAEYAFLSEFSNLPFSSLDNNGDESATFYPVEIPDGDATHPGYTNSLALTIFPVEIQRVVVTNTLTQQNAGDLVVSVDHSTVANGDGSVVLINHDSPATFGTYTTIYDDSGENDIAGSQPSDGPGSLNAFAGQEGMGVWLLHASDNAPSFVGSEQGSLYLQRHQPLQNGGTNTVAPGGWYFDYIDVPAGATNLAINVTNITPSPDLFNPLQLFIKFGSQPTTNDFDKMTVINNGAPPVGSLTVGLADAPPLRPGRYYVGVFNPSLSAQTFTIFATLLPPSPRGTTVDFASAGPVPLPDDAVTVSSNSIIAITNGDPRVTGPVASVNVGIVVRHPRISDLVFTLISPGGQRILLMENRGGTTTNGAGGGPTIVTNTVLSSGFEGQNGDYTNGQSVAGWNVASGQVSVVTDPANAYQGSNFLALANGTISASVPTTVGQTYTLSFAYRGPGIVGWWRGENNTLDSVGGNNGSWNGTSGYSSGEVSQAFNFNGASWVQVPDAVNLRFTNAMTVEAWVYLNTFSGTGSSEIVSKFGGPYTGQAAYTFSVQQSTQKPYFIVNAFNGGSGDTISSSIPITTHQWFHLAGVYDGSAIKIYVNGQVEGTSPWTQGIFPGDNPLVIGCTLQNFSVPTSYFNGLIDEASLYNRALSSSEIAAIYTDGTAGKFDPFASSIVTGLAKAQVTVNGSNAPAFFGNNTNWQTTNITFTATQSATTIQFAGMEPGMLLDNVSVTNVETNYEYLTFTEDTNLTTTPIKFAVPPFTNTSGYFSSQSQILYTNGFEGSVGSEWSNPQTDVTPIGSRRFLGQFGPTNVTLSLNNLPVHTNLTLGFDFFQIRSWDGNYPASLNPIVGPDFWTLQVAGSPAPLLYTTFICAADAGYYQSYPSNYPASFPAYTGAIETNTLGYNDPPNNITPDNAVYRMHYSFAHTNGSIQVQFIGGETQDVTDESWGLDNVFVDANVLIPGLYYLPEQSLDSLDGLNAQGDWTLEVQDDRAGAYDSNNPPELVSWELQFVFADTNAIPAVAGGGLGQTNFVGAGGIAWYQINVPTNANYATNLLLFASAPVNVWFSTNSPPTITNTPNDQILIPSGTNGLDILTTNGTPPLVPGSTYYLGVQNPDNATVNYGIEVDFDHGNSTNSTLPQLIISKVVQTGGGKIQFQWTASSGAQVEVQWTTNLASQAWNTITNPATTTSNGVSTFTDDGSQTAPLGGVRFYRLVQPSP